MKIRITIFTPTYNRAHLLPRLYESLYKQTFKDFEWVIVDDGSVDGTEHIIESFINEKIIPIKYIKQSNGGKHRAINKGVQEAKGELFFIVDSDDYLTNNAIERINNQYSSIKNNECFAGICGLKCFSDGTKVGGGGNFGILDCTSLEFRYKYNIRGDMAEVLRTEVLKQYPFPEIENEKFCPEAVLFNRIAKKYKLRYFYENIYVCDYLPDGLTAKITKIRMQSPKASMICYSELVHSRIPFIQKLKSAINFWRFSFCSDESLRDKISRSGIGWLICHPIGYIMHLKDKKKYDS